MPKHIPITIDGVTFPSIIIAAKELNIPVSTLQLRLTKNAKTCAIKPDHINAKSISYRNQTYPSIKAFADQFGLSYQVVQKQLQRGKTPDEIIEHHNKKTVKGLVKKHGRKASKKKSL